MNRCSPRAKYLGNAAMLSFNKARAGLPAFAAYQFPEFAGA